jgi:hypothetical protein
MHHLSIGRPAPEIQGEDIDVVFSRPIPECLRGSPAEFPGRHSQLRDPLIVHRRANLI